MFSGRMKERVKQMFKLDSILIHLLLCSHISVYLFPREKGKSQTKEQDNYAGVG